MIKSRDEQKKLTVDLAASGDTDAASVAWSSFKKIRNKVNNRTKYEEKHFKVEKMSESLDSPEKTWRTAKSFMDWKQTGGPPHQLSIRVGSKLLTKASLFASEMNLSLFKK